MAPSENGHAPKRDRKWKRMETKRLSQQDIQTAADLLRTGGLVGIPTETVYGWTPLRWAGSFRPRAAPRTTP